MKRVLFLLIACIAMFACTSKEQKMSEELLKGSLKAPSTYKFISFEEESVVTLGNELEGRISLFESNVKTDSSFVKVVSESVNYTKDHLKELQQYQKSYGGWESSINMWTESLSDDEKKLSDYESKLQMDQNVLAYLKGLLESEDLSKVTGKIYVLTYEAQNTFGVPLKGVFRTHFKSNGELVEYKSEDEKWVVIGDVFSIPGYYDLIGKAKEEE